MFSSDEPLKRYTSDTGCISDMRKITGIITFFQFLLSNNLLYFIEAFGPFRDPGIYNITPLYYKLILKPDINSNNIFCECHITIHIEENKQIIGFLSNKLHTIYQISLRKMDPKHVEIYDHDQRFFIATYTPQEYGFFDSRLEIFILYFNETLEHGHYVLDMKYTSVSTTNLSKDGFLRAPCVDGYGIRRWMIATRIQNTGPQIILPCWNNSRSNTVFHISIRHPNDYFALSSLIPSKFESDDNYMTWTHFEYTPVSLHCISIVIMPDYIALYNDKDDDDNMVMLYSLLDYATYQIYSKFAWDIIMKIKTYMKQQNVVDYCHIMKTNYIAVRGFPHDHAVVTPAFVLFREDLMFVNGTSAIEKQGIVTRFLVQQMADQWILRLTHPLYWSSSWLHDVSTFLSLHLLEITLSNFELQPWSVTIEYEKYSTDYPLNFHGIMYDILSSRSKFAVLHCNNRIFTETELSLTSLINESTCSSDVLSTEGELIIY